MPWQSHKEVFRRFIPCLWDPHVGTLSLLGMTAVITAFIQPSY